ncbi:hypothetical protein LIER_37027 [Lithospermum erythrorhizon]|uniref:Membrane-associated kinase regulator 2 n=1 Tax=Lithospermum erythrorhizon TaxID=34254 RepID=A0AAV3PE42_LITER
MEAFSLLKYWRTTSTALTKPTQTTTTTDCSSSTTTTTPIIATASPRSSTSSSDNDHGPYFDLEFALRDENDETSLNHNAIDELIQENETEEDEVEVSLRISSSSSSNDSTKEHSNEDNVCFNGHLVPIETSSLIVSSTDSTSKFPNNLLKSASKFKVLMALKLKKIKENADEEVKKEGEKPETENNINNPSEKETQKRKFFTVKFIKVDDVPIVSLFTRDHSSKSENRKEIRSSPLHKNPNSAITEGLCSSTIHKNPPSVTTATTEGIYSLSVNKNHDSATSEVYSEVHSSTAYKNSDSTERNNNVKPNEDTKDEEEKRFTKDMIMQKYLKMVKPLYVRASKRYVDKMRFSGQLVSFSGGENETAPPCTAEVKGGGEVEAVVQSVKSNKKGSKSLKERNFTAGLRVVLGKSKSASAVPVEAPPLSKRRDDSLIQQQDGIQSAIMHCKRSFNASRESSATVVKAASSTKGQIV